MNRLPRARVAVLAGALLAAACSPTYNWREVQPERSGAVAMFPCRPSHEVRDVSLAGAPVSLTVVACHAGDAMFALSYADVQSLERVAPALRALRAAAVGNLAGAVTAERPAQVDGMTPQPEARAIDVDGRLPGGDTVHERVVVFSAGARIYQATMFGRKLDSDARDTFFGGLHLPPP
jgi:hypothetical protein